MRNILIGQCAAIVLAVSAIAIGGCNSTSSTAESAAGGSATSGGSVGAGGSSSAVGGSSANGGSVGVGGNATGVGGVSSGTGGSTTSAGGSTTSAGGGTGDAVTTLSSTKALNALTAAEATQLCNDTYTYFERSISKTTVCKWKGVYFATQSSAPTEEKLRSNCSSKEDPCLAASGSPWDMQSCSEIPTDCTKTVADYSTCIKDQSKWLVEKVGELPGCATFTSSFWTPVWDIVGATQPTSCEFCSGFYAPDPRQF